MIEKQSVIKLSSNSSKNYASEVLSDSEVAFLREGADAAFNPSLYSVFFIHSMT